MKLSDSAKNAIRSQRRRLANEQAAAAADAALAARSLLGREVKPLPICPPAPKAVIPSATLGYHKAVVPRCAAVLASEGIRARLVVNLNEDVERAACTDFSTITVNYPVSDKQDPAEVAAILRGTIYHEGGHCRFTTKPTALFAAYRALPDVDSRVLFMMQNQCDLLHYAWNLCEDQRMEMLVVEDSPRKGAYFAPMVIDMVIDTRKMTLDVDAARRAYEALMDSLVLNGVIDPTAVRPFDEKAARAQRVTSYPLIAWRRYLPRDLRLGMRREFVAVWGLARTVKIERLILAYIKTADTKVAVEALAELAPLLAEVMCPPSDHSSLNSWTQSPQNQTPGAEMEGADDEYGEGEGEGEGDGEGGSAERDEAVRQALGDRPGKPRPGKQQPSPSVSHGQGDEKPLEADDNGGADEGGTKDAGNDDSGADTDGDDGSGTGSGPSAHTPVDDMLTKAKADAEAERASDSALRGDVEAFNAVVNDHTGSNLLPYTTMPTDDPEINAEARNMAQEVVQAFNEVNTERLPTWQEQQTRGVLNVNRYLTRQHGDREFFRCWADEVAPGRNIAVSVLLDYSGSMGSLEASLATTAYAMKAACDDLGIVCTVLLWDHDATVLWDGLDKAEFVPVIAAAGGTNPQVALEDLPFHRHGKDAHIVLIMTDGQFSSKNNWLNEYRTEGTYFLGAVLGGNAQESERRMATMGFDRYMGITNLRPLVSMLEQSIIDIAASA